MNNKTFFALATCLALVAAGCDAPNPKDVVVESEPTKSGPPPSPIQPGVWVRISLGDGRVARGIVEDTHDYWKGAYVIFIDSTGTPVRMSVLKTVLTVEPKQ